MPERKFEEFCENSDFVAWFYKNGDKGTDFYSVVYKDGSVESINNLFLALPVSGNRLYFELGLLADDNGYIDVDDKYRSSIKNIYAVGDMTNGIHQISTAVYSGMIAALDIIKEIKNA